MINITRISKPVEIWCYQTVLKNHYVEQNIFLIIFYFIWIIKSVEKKTQDIKVLTDALK